MSSRTKLVLLSFLMLFVELVLIRWLGSNVFYLSYFSNFVLLGSFLGIGLGFLWGNDRPPLFRWAPFGLAAIVAFVLIFPVEVSRNSSELIFLGSDTPTGLPPWLLLPLIFVAVAAVMMCFGDGVSRVFAEFEPLEAYRYDIVGSILGIAAFSALSFLRAPPLVWGLVVVALLVATLERPIGLPRMGMLAVLVLLLLIETRTPNTSWSPYYKIEARPTAFAPGALDIAVNQLPHQVAAPLEAHDGIYRTVYDLGLPELDEVLIIGAGSGNDVARALSEGAKHVDAVEIDPRIQEIGVEQHPNRPYDDPRVTRHINDGRAFLHQTDKQYDLIILALPDSLTLVSGQSSLRLESYLFTREAFEEVREHLAPDGVFSMYNIYRELWLRDRYANTVREVFGEQPCVDTLEHQFAVAVITASREPGRLHCHGDWTPAGAIAPPATDDHPFPYLQDDAIPSFYLLALGLVLAAALGLVRWLGGPLRRMSPYVDLFCMGVAFLLLETKSVVQFALLFGTTWFVNALVFAGVLVSVYLAVELARRVRLPRPLLLYAVLLAALVMAWLVPVESLLGLPPVARFLVSTVLAFAPIFIANLVFAQRFAEVGSSTTAFGANLLGAMVGGVIEYAALVVGYRNLLVLVALFYAGAFLFGQATWMRNRTGPGGELAATPATGSPTGP